MKEVIIFSDVGFDLSDNTDDLCIEAVGQLFAELLSDRQNKIPFNHISCLNLPTAFFWWLFLDEFLLGFLLMKTENSVRAKDGFGCLYPLPISQNKHLTVNCPVLVLYSSSNYLHFFPLGMLQHT